MKFDKNTVIGIVLLAILFGLYFWQVNKTNEYYMSQQKHVQDSIARVEATKAKPVDAKLIAKEDSSVKVGFSGNFGGAAAFGKEELTTIENKLIKVTFTNKGGRIKHVELKAYTDYNHKPVVLGNDTAFLTYTINTSNTASITTDELFFAANPVVKNNDQQTIQFSLKDSSGRTINHTYILKENEYTVDWNIDVQGAGSLFTGNQVNFMLKSVPDQAEASQQYERQMTNICFSENNEFDYISSKTDHQFEKPVQWVSVVQQFFNTTVIAKNSFTNGNVQWKRAVDSSSKLGKVDANLQMKIPAGATVSIPLQMYYGPNDYNILKKQAPEMAKIVNLGRDVYAFVRPINMFIIRPVFDFFAGLVANFGWVIMLLTIFIRLVTSPLTYSSYLSGAKMKALKPELDGLKKKFGTDQQGFAMEQMKLFREAGVNPLGGCIPALLQIPIFFALYSFFNSNISLRGQSFLWSHDLSQYDVIARLPFTIPMGFGDHISLFTITAVITSFAISMYNMGSTPTQDNPAMKYMPYIFPFMMLFFFNRLPAALTWYYTVSNTLTLLLQFIIQKYIINHDQILAKLQEARTKPKAKSKWQERYAQVMETQKKVQEMKEKTTKK